jgi:hypothetical protein
MPDIDSVRDILRALAEARDAAFYSLYVDLTYRFKGSVPNLGFRIHQIADSNDALLVVGVSITRPDGVEISWSLSIRTADESLVISASVEISDERGYREVFERSTETGDSRQAAALIHTYANQVCAERHWLDDTNIEIGAGRQSL